MVLNLFRPTARLAVALVFACLAASASAQDAAPKPEQEAAPGAKQDAAPEVKQFKLTDTQVTGFVAAQKEISAISEKIQKAGDAPDEALQKELDGIATKHGFKDFQELDDVAANISIVMAGLDPQTGAFTDPLEALKKELTEVQADASIPEAEKKQLVDELTEAIRTTPPLENKENIDVVKVHREAIDKALQ